MHPLLQPSPLRDLRNLTVAFLVACGALLAMLFAAASGLDIVAWF